MLRVYCKKEKVKNEIFMELLSRATSVTSMNNKKVRVSFNLIDFYLKLSLEVFNQTVELLTKKDDLKKKIYIF